MKIESSPNTLNQPIVSVFQKLEKVDNFKTLMPENLEKFSVSDDSAFAFALKGMPEIFLEKKQIIPHSQMVYGAKEGKIPFELTIRLEEISPNQTQISFVFEGNFIPMMAMMIKGPITKLLETMSNKVKEL